MQQCTISEENYKNYHTVKFKCNKCGYECNADFNASVNIARLFYENLHNNQMDEVKKVYSKK